MMHANYGVACTTGGAEATQNAGKSAAPVQRTTIFEDDSDTEPNPSSTKTTGQKDNRGAFCIGRNVVTRRMWKGRQHDICIYNTLVLLWIIETVLTCVEKQ